jgi:hypothetical protein
MTTVPSTARAAFFQRAVMPVAPVAQAQPAAASVEKRVERPQTHGAEPAPDRPLRPGSIIDIKV